MPKQNNIDFNLNFKKGDVSGLENLKKELAAIKMQVSNPDWALHPLDIKNALNTVNTLEKALTKAFDVNLNTINIQKFNNILAQSGLNAKTIQQNLALAGVAGNQAFLKLTSQLMQFNTATRQTNAFLDNLATSFFNTAKYTAFNAIFNTIGSTVSKANTYVKNLDTSLNDIRIVTGKSADEMERFAESANDAAKQLAVTTSDYTKGSLIYYQQGLDDETVKTLTDVTAMTANVTGQSMETVSEQLTAVWNGYQVANEAAQEGMQIYQEYVDKMAAVGATTASDLQELSAAMSKVASAASAMGVSFDDLNAQIATIVSVTRQAPESVGTALKTIYARLGDLKVDGVDEFGTKMGEVSSQLQTMGINILDTNGDMRDMSDVITEVASKWDTWTSAQKQAAAVAMAGKRQYNNLIALFDNWDMYGEALETSMSAAGTLEKQQEIALDSLANKMDQLSATAEDFYDSLINENTIKGLVEGLTKVVQLLADFADATGGLNNLLPILGSTALRVFNQQIAEGLSTIIINMQTVKSEQDMIKENQAALQSMFSDSTIFTPIQGDDNVILAQKQSLQEMINYYQKIQQYQGIMSEEQREQHKNILDMTRQAGELNIKIEQQKNNWLATYKTLQPIKKDVMVDLVNNIDKVVAGVQKIKTVTNALQDTLNNGGYTKNQILNESDFENLIKSLNLQVGNFEDKIITRFRNINGASTPIIEVLQQIINELNQVGNGANNLINLQTRMDSLSNSAKVLGDNLEYSLNIKQFIGNITTTIGAIGQLASALSILQYSKQIWNNEDLTQMEKMTQLAINASMAFSIMGTSLKSLNKVLKLSTFFQTLYTASVDASMAGVTGVTAAQYAWNTAISASPLAPYIAVLGLLIGVLTVVENHYEKIKQEAKEAAEEAQNSAAILQEEAEAHKSLTDEYNTAYEQYKQGTITKEELWKTTDKLIDVYDLESSRISILSENYADFANAVKRAREEEEQELIVRNREAVQKTAISAKENAKGSVIWGNGISESNGQTRVDLLNAQSQVAIDKQLQEQAKEFFGDKYDVDSGKVIFDSSNAADLVQTVTLLRQWRTKLAEQVGEDNDRVKKLDEELDAFNKDNNFDNLVQAQDDLLQSLINSSNLDTATSQEDFDNSLEELRNTIQKEINLGNLVDSEDIDQAVNEYIGQIHSSFANKAIIDETIRNKFGEEVLSLLNQTDFYKYDEATQSAIIGLGFDFSQLNSSKGKEKLNTYVKFITGNEQGIYFIPVSFQDQINDTVLKGKDIAKADWESMQSTLSPEANQILGDREEFNNKSIGERIALLQQVNELTRENNLLAIEQYEKNKQASEQIISDLEKQEELLKQKANDATARSFMGSEEDRKAAQEELRELQTQLEEISQKKYEIEVSLDMDIATDNLVQSIIGDVMTEADQMKAAAESIGEGWKVAAEDVATFAAAFPELMEGMERLEDGSLQLNKEIVNNALEASQAEINANKKVAIEAAETKIKQLKLELQFKEQQEEILTEALEGNKTAEETKQALADAAFDYQTQLLDNGLIAEADALTKAQIQEQTGVDGMINILSGLNEAINTIHHNFANMLTTDGEMLSLDAVAGSVKQITSSSVDTTKLKNNGFDTSDIDAMIDARNKLQQEQSQIKTQIASYEGFVSEMMNSVSEMDKAADRVQSGLAGKEDKSKSGSSSKNKKDKELKKLDEEFDRYWEINKALDLIDRNLKKIDKDQENLYGKELIRSLKQENELLDNQAQLYEQLYAAQQAEAAELRGQLSNMGVSFDASSGAITNYAQAVAQALATYNAAVTAFNNGPQDEAAQKSLEAAEKAYENFKKLIERYDTLVYNEMQDTQEKLDEIWRKQLANNLKAWEVEIQLKLDFKQLERDWNDFIKEVTSDFKKVFKDLRVESKNMLKDATTYVGEEGTINTIIGAVHDVTGEIDKMMSGGTSDKFESVSQAQEKLKELNDELLKSGQSLHDLWGEAWDNYLDGIDQVDEKFENISDRYERINEELEFQGQLIELLYGDEAYALMSKYYEGMEKNTMGQIESTKQQADMWKQLFEASGASMDNQLDWDEDQKKYYENWMNAQSKLNDLVIDYIELLKKDYLNTVSDVLKELEKYVTGSSLDDINTEWERISANADKYYDSVEGAYYIQTLANKIDQSIADANNLQAQQKLMKLREKEIDYLREKENLTEYDIKAAELRYQLALKEIALEDAQNNKTGMKLTRNDQGNWSYQYVADESDIISKRQELLDTYNSLYQLASDAYESNLEALTELQEKYLESAKKIYEDDTLTEEERQQKLLELRDWYLQEYQNLAEENQLYRDDLATAGAGLLLELYEQDRTTYESMTETERGLVDTLIKENISDYRELEEAVKDNYQGIKDKAEEVMRDTRQDWTSGAQTIADRWNKDNGFSVKTEVVKAYDRIEEANQDYQRAVDECAQKVERDFTEQGIMGAIQRAEDETDNLKDKTIELVNESIPYLQALKEYVDQIAEAWQSVQQAIMDAINLINEYLRKVGEANAAVQRQAEIAQQQAAAQAAAQKGSDNTKRSPSIDKTASDYYTDPYGASGTRYSNGKIWGIEGYDPTYNLNYITLPEKKKKMAGGNYTNYMQAYASGGYTGEWDNSGKLAILHEKELVLNADDTKNFLSGINMMRNMVSNNGSIEKAVLKAAANMAYSLSNITPGSFGGTVSSNNSSNENVFNITAEFPNANNVDDIRQAILTLPNYASQVVNSTLK